MNTLRNLSLIIVIALIALKLRSVNSAPVAIGFNNSNQQIGNHHSNDVALGDLDGDGDLDAFTANFGSIGGENNHVWINLGGEQAGAQGFYIGTNQNFASDSSYDVELGDLNGDGTLDAFVGNAGADTVLLNDGTGIFTQNCADARHLYKLGGCARRY